MSSQAAGMKGKLTVTVVEVKELKDTEILGKMDPYVAMEVGKEKHKTSVKKNAGRAATFNEAFIFNLEGKEDSLHVNVWDKELISDDHVGRVDVPLQKLAALTAPTWYQLIDRNNFSKIAGQICLTVSFVGTGGPAVAQAAATAAAAVKQQAPVAAAAPAAPQQPQVIYAQQPQPQVIMQAPQPQLVRGTDGKLYAIAPQQQVVMQQQPQVIYAQQPQPQVVYAQQPQPQVVYMQAPAVQQPRYM